MLVLDLIHSLYAVVGVAGNVILLAIIIGTKSSGLKSYSVIIFNVACVDIIEIALDAFEVPRLVANGEDTILLFHGQCKTFGAEVCYRCHLVMLHLLFHSLFLIAYSFWYRYSILVKTAPSWFTVQTTILVLFIPNAVPMILSMFARDNPSMSKDTLESLYPNMDFNATAHRSVNLFDPFSAPTDFSAMIGPFGVYSFIVVIRRKVLQKLAALATNMSAKTQQMHASLVRALTYHAILPFTICIGVASFYFQMIGYRSSFIDSLMFIFACIPAIINPILTLFFIAPYRRRLLRVFGHDRGSTVFISPSSNHDSKVQR